MWLEKEGEREIKKHKQNVIFLLMRSFMQG